MAAPEFVALADVLRAGATAARAPFAPAAVEPAAVAHADVAQAEVVHAESGAAAREARLFRARLVDAFDEALARLLRELAANVLARELRLAPCDIAAITRRVREEAPIVRLRTAAVDASGDCELPVTIDPELQAGDAVFELVGGALDARLGVRLASVLDAVSTPASAR